jgi:osmotically inducible protein OsmC
MAAMERRSDVVWTGDLKGSGRLRVASAAFPEQTVTFDARTGAPVGKTSPEELIAAAHAACYAMALNATLGRKNAKARKTYVTARVVADKGDAGIKITHSHLKVVVEGLEGMTPDEFKQTAKDAEKACPVSNALRALTIDVDAAVR